MKVLVKKKKVEQIIPEPIVNEQPKVYSIRQLRCIVDGSEIRMKEIKKAIENQEVDELWIFSISNKLYREITAYLKENEVKHTIYGRSRIVIYYK